MVGTAPGSTPVLLDPIGTDGSGNGCTSLPFNQLVECSRPEHPAWLGNNKIVWDGALGKGLWQISASGGNATEISGTDQSTSNIVWLNGLAGSYDGTNIAASGSPISCSTCGEGIYTLPGGGGTHSNTFPAPASH